MPTRVSTKASNFEVRCTRSGAVHLGSVSSSETKFCQEGPENQVWTEEEWKEWIEVGYISEFSSSQQRLATCCFQNLFM